MVRSDGIVTTARHSLYSAPVVYAQQSDYQEIIVTQRGKDRRLYLNGGLQYSTRDEYRYTESLTYPALTFRTRNVLVIGGGDGLAARELLRMPHIEHITQVELDPAMLEVANTVLREDNKAALEDPKVEVLARDAFSWIRNGVDGTTYDAILVDLPDPDTDTIARLYSAEFYGMLLGSLAPEGKMVVQSGSAFTTPDLFNRVRSTLLEAGCADVTPYHVSVPTFGDWGFNQCTTSAGSDQLELPKTAPQLRFLNEETLAAASVFPPDNPLRLLEPSTLDHPRVVEDLRRGYRQADP